VVNVVIMKRMLGWHVHVQLKTDVAGTYKTWWT